MKLKLYQNAEMMNPKQIVKESIEEQFENYVVDNYGQYGFDPYGWEPDIVSASDSLLGAGFEWPDCSPESDLSDQYWGMVEGLVSDIDLDEIKEEVLLQEYLARDQYRTDKAIQDTDRADDLRSMSMRIVAG